MRSRLSIFFFFMGILLLAVFVTSCVNTRKAIYFNEINDGVITANTPVPEPKIQKNDILSIIISDIDQTSASYYNTMNNTLAVTNQNGSLAVAGYLVAPDGTIQFPVLGSLKAEGLTKDQLKDNIRKELITRKLLLDPIISIRFLSFHVTVLGEVNHPSDINIPNEKISLLEAIGLAGDLTIYAKRDNILVIREENGNKVIKRLDLNSNELLSSPYYYLQSNDIVYVEPNKSRVASTGRGQQWIPAVLSGLSLIAIVVDRIVK